MRYLASAICAFSLSTSMASAQDWTGGFVGLQLGGINLNLGDIGRATDVAYGLNAGYRYTFSGGFNLGAEVQYDGTNVKIDGAKLNSVARYKLNFGYDAGFVLPYVTAGGARANTSLGGTNGWTAGVGIIYQVSPNIEVGAEVLTHEFDRVQGVKPRATSGMFRLSYRF